MALPRGEIVPANIGISVLSPSPSLAFMPNYGHLSVDEQQAAPFARLHQRASSIGLSGCRVDIMTLQCDLICPKML